MHLEISVYTFIKNKPVCTLNIQANSFTIAKIYDHYD